MNAFARIMILGVAVAVNGCTSAGGSRRSTAEAGINLAEAERIARKALVRQPGTSAYRAGRPRVSAHEHVWLVEFLGDRETLQQRYLEGAYAVTVDRRSGKVLASGAVVPQPCEPGRFTQVAALFQLAAPEGLPAPARKQRCLLRVIEQSLRYHRDRGRWPKDNAELSAYAPHDALLARTLASGVRVSHGQRSTLVCEFSIGATLSQAALRTVRTLVIEPSGGAYRLSCRGPETVSTPLDHVVVRAELLPDGTARLSPEPHAETMASDGPPGG